MYASSVCCIGRLGQRRGDQPGLLGVRHLSGQDGRLDVMLDTIAPALGLPVLEPEYRRRVRAVEALVDHRRRHSYGCRDCALVG